MCQGEHVVTGYYIRGITYTILPNGLTQIPWRTHSF